FVVSTDVGGVSEVLPGDVVSLAAPDAEQLAQATVEAVKKVQNGKLDKWAMHDRVKGMYSWHEVAKRTVSEKWKQGNSRIFQERVYRVAMSKPIPTFAERVQAYVASSCYSNWAYAIVTWVQMFWCVLVCLWRPV